MMPTADIWPTIDRSDRRIFVSDEERNQPAFARVSTFFADLHPSASHADGLAAQLLYGDEVRVIGKEGEFLKVVTRLSAGLAEPVDHYVGWVLSSALDPDMTDPTHMIAAPRTFLYPGPDMKKPRCGYRSMGSKITVVDEVETRGTPYVILSGGEAVIARHVAPINKTATDYVAVAERLLNTPYLWGGNTGFGLDCSGLVQLSMRMAGCDVVRDADMQAATIGKPVDVDDTWQNLQRGDLIFWRGHVAIAQGIINDAPHIIHANGYTMDVTSEPALQAIERIAYLYEMPIGVRRPAL